MKKHQFTVQTEFSQSCETVYKTWMSSKGHSEMTGGEAVIQDEVGTTFSAWDGYITGANVALEPNKRIFQSWRTTEFGSEDDDSQVDITLEEKDGSCLLTLKHSHIPMGQSNYETGWEDHYFTPMKQYFDSLR